MKEINLMEDDSIFGGSFSPEQYLFYTDHKDAIKTMWKDQGPVFWLNMLTKFRIYIVKHGHLSPFNTMVTNGALDYPFIIIAKRMTGTFGEVAEFMKDISIVMQNMHLSTNMLKQTCANDPFINPVTRNSFRNLFGPPDNKLRILRTFIFAETFCCWGGALVKLLPLWKSAVGVYRKQHTWTVTHSYTCPSPLRTGPFEQYLRNAWKEQITDVCGAPPEQLIWWRNTTAGGRVNLPPMEEYSALSRVFDYLMDLAGEAAPEIKTEANKIKAERLAADANLRAANLLLTGQTNATGDANATGDGANGTEKKKKKKKKKANKTKPTEPPVKVAAEPAKKPSESVKAVAEPAKKPSEPAKGGAETAKKSKDKKPAASAATQTPPLPPPPPPPPELVFPAVPRAVSDATLEWHEYVTAVAGTERLLQNQVRGGALQLGWTALIIEDIVLHSEHMDYGMNQALREKLVTIKQHWTSAKKALTGKSARNGTSVLRTERDHLSTRIPAANIVLTAAESLRLLPGKDPVSDLLRIRGVVNDALCEILRICPMVYQYSVTETVEGDPRIIYPDLSRIRYLMRKGLALQQSPMPKTKQEANVASVLAIEWYPELLQLSRQLTTHLTQQLRTGAVLEKRLADRQGYTFDADAKVLHAMIGNPVTFAAMRRVFLEIRDLTGGENNGPVPPRPARLLPHTGQSLVDAYWCRLTAMTYITDLLGVIPVSPNVGTTLLLFKYDALNALMDSVVELQLAQWRWLYPRTELEMPRRPAFRRAADASLLADYLDHADMVLRKAHERLGLIYATIKKGFFGKPPAKDTRITHTIHVPDDLCVVQGSYVNPDHCNDCMRHAIDVANRRLLCGLTLHIRSSLWSGCDLSKVVESLHVLPCYLVLVQDYKAKPTKSGAAVIEKTFLEVLRMVRTVDDDITTSINNVIWELSEFPAEYHASLRQLGHREGSIREIMMIACDELAKKISLNVAQGRPALDIGETERMLEMATSILKLDVGGCDIATLSSADPLPPPPAQRLRVTCDWPKLLEDSEELMMDDWDSCVVDKEAATEALTAPGRASPSDIEEEDSDCTRRIDLEVEWTRIPCRHDHPQTRLCTTMLALRDIRFVDNVVNSTYVAGVPSIHSTVLNVLRECWLPYLLCADRVLRSRPIVEKRCDQHAVFIDCCEGWVEDTVQSLYKLRSKIGPGRMLRFDRSWMKLDANLKPDSTMCRTISWSQACDLHNDIMRRLVNVLYVVRSKLPPVLENGCEVHPAPLELLARVETGAVLLVAAFLDYRDGRSSRHLLDVSELNELVPLALDIHGWLGVVHNLVQTSGVEFESFSATRSPELSEDTERAFSMYDWALRHGSLLEFLALRPAHTLALQLAVTANIRRDAASHAELKERISDKSCRHVTLPPIAQLRSRAARSSGGRLPQEWLVRLQQVRRVLLSTARPALLEPALVPHDYRIDCTVDRLPDLPTMNGAPWDMSEAGLFTSGVEVNSRQLCDHVFDLGQHVLKYQTAMVNCFYRTQNDHVFPDRRFFLQAWRPPGTKAEEFEAACASGVMKWASKHVVKQTLVPAAAGPGDVQEGGAGDTAGPDPGAAKAAADVEITAIERLSSELEDLMLSADHLKDIPEEPLEPALLERVGRRAERLSEGVQRLPACALRDSADRLVEAVRRAVAPQSKRARRKTRSIAGSDMAVVDTCLSKLTSVLAERGVRITCDSPTPDGDGDAEPEAAAAAVAVALRSCSFCEKREQAPGTHELCSLCVAAGESEPRAYCGTACQKDDWEMGHWEDHH